MIEHPDGTHLTATTSPLSAAVAARVGAMASAASHFVDSLGAEGLAAAAISPSDDGEWRRWSYLPGDRDGLALPAMTAEQRDRFWALLATGQGSVGVELVAKAMEVERYRRSSATGRAVDDDRYWVRVHGSPDGGEWGWRVNGHHVGLHVVVVGDELTVTPHFVGAEPARIPSGPHAGLRVLAVEEDLARGLVTDLDDRQRALAVVSDEPPDDIHTRNDPVANRELLPGGIGYAQMSDTQQLLCRMLIRRHVDRAPFDLADQCWNEILDTLDDVRFAWAGGLRMGDRHYFCVHGPTFLLEYDNTQDDGNHAHSVWRDLRRDFGGDLLRRHYRDGHGIPA